MGIINASLLFEKVLFYQPWGMGDMIMFSPVLLNFKRMFPQVRIDLACRPAIKEMMSKCPWIERIFELVPPPRRSLATMLKVMREVRKERYSLVFGAASTSTHYMGNLFIRLAGAKYTVGNSIDSFLWDRFSFSCPADRNIHRVEQNKLLFKALAGDEAEFEMKFYQPASDEDHRRTDKILKELGFGGKKILGVHAGCDSGNKYKRWDSGRFNELLSGFLSDYPNTSILGFLGPGEDELACAYPKGKFPDRVAIIKDKLGVVAALLGRCNMVLTTDSGLGHIARAMNTPALAIMGPANPLETMPYGPEGYYVSLEPTFECMPCRQHKKNCNKEENYCLARLSKVQVKIKLYNLWEKYPLCHNQKET